jgi:hypothetical protein
METVLFPHKLLSLQEAVILNKYIYNTLLLVALLIAVKTYGSKGEYGDDNRKINHYIE